MLNNLGADVVVERGELEPNPRLAHILGRVIDACLYAVVFFVPVFFLPATLDALELPKQTFFVLFAGVAGLAWIGQSISLRRFALSRSWLHLVVIIFLVGYLITSWFSLDRYLSFAGTHGQIPWSFATVAAFVLMYLVVVNTVRGTTKLYHLVLTFLGSSVLAGLVGIFYLLGPEKTLNTIGSVNSFAVYMTIPLVLAASLTVLGCQDRLCVLGRGGKPSFWANVLVWTSLAISTIVAILVDYWAVWVAILFGTLLLLVIPILRTRRVERSLKLAVPTALVILSVILLLFRTPITLALPQEVSPSAMASWNIAHNVLQERPIFGSGPGTWALDYAKHRSADVNLSPFWAVRFEQASSTFVMLIATLGLVGIVLWLILIFSAVAKSTHHLLMERNDDTWQAYLTVFATWATTAFIAFLYPYSFTHHFAFWFFLALLAALAASGTLTWDAQRSVTTSSILAIAFLLLCVDVASLTWLSFQRFGAEVQRASATRSFEKGSPIQQSIDALTSAAMWHRWNDTYPRGLSEAYLLRANQELLAPADAERQKKVNASVAKAVEYAQRATEISPTNVENWASFAMVLQSIASFTPGADERAIELFRAALLREPNNPAFYTEIGRLHVFRKEYDKAAEAFGRAIQIKPDFAPAHYNIGLVHEQQGRVGDAIIKLEQALLADTHNVGIAFQLAVLYIRNNEKDKALDMLEQIVALAPTYVNARWYLAWIYEERGRYDHAIAQVQKISALDPDNAIVRARLDRLIGLRDRKAQPAAKPLPEPVREEISTP